MVSVIGAQSSAKSTLLNFLFGSGFAVSSGRCTRGLYASYFSSGPKGLPVLVLDSEGLLSLGSEGSTFDGQIVAGTSWQNCCIPRNFFFLISQNDQNFEPFPDGRCFMCCVFQGLIQFWKGKICENRDVALPFFFALRQ